MKIRVTLKSEDGDPGDDGLNTDHRYLVEVQRPKRDVTTVTGDMYDVAVWLASHYWFCDVEDRLSPLRDAVLLND